MIFFVNFGVIVCDLTWRVASFILYCIVLYNFVSGLRTLKPKNN